MRKWFSKLFDIRPGEMLRAWLMFIYLFLIIASLLIIKPVRNSLFLTSFGSHRLPYVYPLFAAAGIAIIRVYAFNWKINMVFSPYNILTASGCWIF